MNTLRMVPSLSGLLMFCRENGIPADAADTVYAFGSTREGIDETFHYYYPKATPEVRAEILGMLDKAESEGRVSWRTTSNSLAQKFIEERQAFLRRCIESRGGVVNLDNAPVSRGYSGDIFYDAAINIPAMRSFLAECVENLEIEVLDYMGFQTPKAWRI